MLFSSPAFFVFFAVYFALHLLTPRGYRVYLVIAGSTIFYSWWKLEYVWVPYLLVLIAYFGANWISADATERDRRRRMICVIVVLFLPLLVIKYADFFVRELVLPFVQWHVPLLNLSLPLGISFVTFTLAAYVVNVYRRQFPPGTSLTMVLAYTLFFPHLIAGPILRPHELIPQLEAPRARSIRPAAAIGIFTIGLVKKLVFADQIGSWVDQVYSGGTVSAPAALLAIYGFSVQIYCDFSGYTDMAIGLAMLIGVKLPNNFARPYSATSLVDFWRRWHITLSYWLRDYLYIPLGGNRHGRFNEFRNILITMVLGGLWHGANWTFIIWGLLHGLGIAFSHQWRRLVGGRLPLPNWLAIFLTFHFVTLAWLFFRARNVTQAVDMLWLPFVGDWSGAAAFLSSHAFPLLLIVVFFLLHGLDDHRYVKLAIRRMNPAFVWAAIMFCWVIAIAVSQGSSAKFVYFDF